jgi:hypothetical protein
MIISHKYKFIFIKTAKTAGTSIEVFLSKLCADEDVVTPIFPAVDGHVARNYKGIFNPFSEILDGRTKGLKLTILCFCRNLKFKNHLPSFIIKNRIDEEVWNSYTKFCVERDPWDKTVSHYEMINKRSGGNLSFYDYLKKGNFCLNFNKYLHPVTNDVMVDRILRYESLNQDLQSIFEDLGVPFNGALTENAKSTYRNRDVHYSSYYDKESAELIRQVFKKELAVFNYQFLLD